ncbi:MAG: TetR/AcrR family transcriptional regulator [Magnetococcales bacterium]|nr:TetR/AcrR family transcriptional regulator [Magnetococcales bacterium]
MANQEISQSRRQEMVQTARKLFLLHGYAATSMDKIATETGMAKQTLYNHFGNKENLFTEVIRQTAASFLIPLQDENSPLPTMLHDFGKKFRHHLLSDEGLAMYRILMAEAYRFPDLARNIYQSGPGATIHLVTQVMNKAMQEGALQPGDPQFAAEMLLSMLVGTERTLRLLGDQPANESDDEHKLAHIIQAFMKAFAPANQEDYQEIPS